MALIYNMDIFQKAGLDPSKGPETWEDVKNFSKQIKDKTGKAGFGMVGKLNAGNTPYRYMPLSGPTAVERSTKHRISRSTRSRSSITMATSQALQWISICIRTAARRNPR